MVNSYSISPLRSFLIYFVLKTSTLIIKNAKIEDARRISYLIRKNTLNVLENKYSKEQKAAWIKANTVKSIEEKILNYTIFCAFRNKRLVGTIGLNKNELFGLYIGYTQRGKGIGKQLLLHVEKVAKSKGYNELFLTSTPAGFDFYKSKGFTQYDSFKLSINKVDFFEPAMKKLIK